MRSILLLLCFMTIISCATKKPTTPYKTEILEIEPITTNTYIHKSFLETNSWGKVSCNGMVYINKGEAIIFDTPASIEASSELINWVENKMKVKVKAVVVNHFHGDCLAGLNVFHDKGIESYSTTLTQKLAKADTLNKPVIPKNGFETDLSLLVGNERVINKYFGEGHTKDNIVSYIPAEKVMFGGCMIKELGAGKGNLADANISEWANSVTRVKKEFPDVKYIIPGHGKTGNSSLLDYTIRLFNNNEDAIKSE